MSYKKLGDYIEIIDKRNRNLSEFPLLGVSVQKKFIPSIANIVGTDMSKYKIIEKNQFTYIADTSRRGDKIGVALLKQCEKALVSQAYTTFKIKDFDKLSPDYLMMWFSRPEFDRFAGYHSIGSVSEVFDWEDMCEVELPIPSIEKQRDLVAQYQAISNKIQVNEQICEKLEATAQTLYKQWFVDFEFPNENGEPYLSSGGKMVFNEELEKEIPEGWEVGKLEDFILIKNGKSKPDSIGQIPVYGGNGIIEYVNKSNYENVNIIGRVGAYCGSVFYNDGHVWISDNALASISKNKTLYFDFLTLKNLNLNSKSEGSSHPLLTQGILNNIEILRCSKLLIYNSFETIILPLFNQITLIIKQNQKLTQVQSLLLSRLATLEG